jgi:hypothetical protein
MAALLASSMFVLPMETSYPRRLLSKRRFFAYSPPSSKVAMLLLLIPVTLWAVVSPGLLAFPRFLNRLLSSLRRLLWQRLLWQRLLWQRLPPTKPIACSYSSAAVVDGGQWMGCVSSHVHTIRLLVWDTLEDFTTILTL